MKNPAVISAKNPEQKEMLKTISECDITFVKGCPGTGKTFLAVGYALHELLNDKYEYIILSRPVVEAGGEKLGFLPGDMEEKINPYMIPIFYSMEQILTDKTLIKKLTNKNGTDPKVRVLPLAFMRGCTFAKSIVILDEMQNSTPEQMRMVLTRFGKGSKMIICGDEKQSDIRRSSGISDAFDLLEGVPGIGFCNLTAKAIVRHPIIEKIENKYNQRVEEE